MHLILSYPSGRRVEAILLAASQDHMRIVVKRLNETLELTRMNGQWTSDRGVPVELECCLADGEARTRQFCSQFAPRSRTAAN